MTCDRFEATPVWHAAADLAAAIFDWVEHPAFRGKGDLADQLQRAALSISNNIAEGFERGTTNELLQFLYYARGSAGEVRSMLGVMELSSRFANLKAQIAKFKTQAESISRQIRGWTNSLQNSDIQGQRHLNDRSRQAYENRQRQQEHQQRMNVFNQDLLARLDAQRHARESSDTSPSAATTPGSAEIGPGTAADNIGNTGVTRRNTSDSRSSPGGESHSASDSETGTAGGVHNEDVRSGDSS